MNNEEKRVADMIRAAFHGVRLGNGVGLMEGRGLDDYADKATLEKYRAKDEKEDWSKIPFKKLNQYGGSLAFFDPEGMRFHLPAYLVADIEGLLTCDILFHLTYVGSAATSRFALLSKSQRQAVREYLSFRLAGAQVSCNDFIEPMLKKSLADYWEE
jgi:hypothetical protein